MQPSQFIPLSISWNLTKRCNLACAHCYIDATQKADTSGELTPEESQKVLKQIAAVNREAVLILTGGEPLLRKDIYDLVASASEMGFWCVLGSHGGLLDEKTAERLVEARLKGVGVSLDSLNPEKHNQFRGISRAWEKTVSALSVMKEKGLPFLIEMTLTRANRSEISAMVAFAYEKGAAAVNFFFLVPTGRGANLSDLSAEEYEETLQSLALIQEEYAGKLLVNAKCAPHYRRVLWERNPQSPFVRTFFGGGCPAGTYYCRITPMGDVTPCPYMPLSIGNLRETPFEILWKESPLLRDFREKSLGGRCGECEFSQFCGGCRCRAYAATGDYLAEDPSCVYQPGKHGKEKIAISAERFYGASASSDEGLPWTEEAEEKIRAVPYFARGMVKLAVESAAKKRGMELITVSLLEELRKNMAGRFPLKKR